MWNNTKLDELNAKEKELYEKRKELTKELDAEYREVVQERYKEYRLKDAYEKAQKKDKVKGSGMNIVFRWDNGIVFDTRVNKRFSTFKDYVLDYGLPTSFDARG